MNKFKRFFIVLLALVGASIPHIASAQLYAKGAPPGSAFIRILNATAAQSPSGFVGTLPQSSLPPYTAGRLEFLPPGSIPVQIGSKTETFALEGDKFYSVAYTAEGLRKFEVEGFKSQLKAMIIMFNLWSDVSLSLKTADGKTSVLESIAPFAAGQREINPLSVALAIFDGDKKLVDVPATIFERGKASTLVIAGSSKVPVLIWDEQK